MALWIVASFIVFAVITMIVLTLYLQVYRDAFQCDTNLNFFCYTDWLCQAGTTNAANVVVPSDKMHCHLKALYSALTAAETGPGGACEGFNDRGSPCEAVEGTRACEGGEVNTSVTEADPFNCGCVVGENMRTSVYGLGTSGEECLNNPLACSDPNDLVGFGSNACQNLNTLTDTC